MAREYDTLQEAAHHDAVEGTDDDALLVEPWGNATLFGRIERGDLRLGNIGVTSHDGSELLRIYVSE